MSLLDPFRGYTYVRRACGHDEPYRTGYGPFYARLRAVDRYRLSLVDCAPCTLREAAAALVRFCDDMWTTDEAYGHCMLCGGPHDVHTETCPYAPLRDRLIVAWQALDRQREDV